MSIYTETQPLRAALYQITGSLPPKELWFYGGNPLRRLFQVIIDWEQLTSTKMLTDEQAMALTDWVGEVEVGWFTNDGVIEAAELLVERAIENGMLSAPTQGVK